MKFVESAERTEALVPCPSNTSNLFSYAPVFLNGTVAESLTVATCERKLPLKSWPDSQSF